MTCRTDDGERFNSLLAVATFSAQIAFAIYPERLCLSVVTSQFSLSASFP